MCEPAVITFTIHDGAHKYAPTPHSFRSVTALSFLNDPEHRRIVELLQDTQNDLQPHF